MTIGPVTVDEVSTVTLLLLAILALLSGLMVPGWMHRRALREKDDRLAIQDQTIRELLEVGETVRQVLVAIRSTAEHNREADADGKQGPR